MANLKNRLTDTTKRLIRRHLKFEMCLVDEVHWHKEPGDKKFNTITVLRRDRRAFTDDGKHYYRPKCLVPLAGIGNHLGWLFSPREGDMVMVYFYQERKGIVLFSIPNWAELPICRPTPCDIALKGGQFMRPKRYLPTGDFLYYPYPEAKKPYCFRWFHGEEAFKNGDIGEGRDWCLLFDYCQLGHSNPECELCKTIDSIQRLRNQYFKFYSEQTESRKAYPYRAEFHARCGSFWMFESTDQPSSEYISEVHTEGEGYWTVQGAKIENGVEVLKGHIRHSPSGTIEVLSATTEDYASGSLALVQADDDSSFTDVIDGDVAAELQHLPSTSRVRIYKSGKIQIVSCASKIIKSVLSAWPDGYCEMWNAAANAYVEITAAGAINHVSPSAINLNAPVINQNGIQIHPSAAEGWIE